jgi:hypothetical protein
LNRPTGGGGRRAMMRVGESQARSSPSNRRSSWMLAQSRLPPLPSSSAARPAMSTTAAPTWTSNQRVANVQWWGTCVPIRSIAANAAATSQCAARSVRLNRTIRAMASHHASRRLSKS